MGSAKSPQRSAAACCFCFSFSTKKKDGNKSRSYDGVSGGSNMEDVDDDILSDRSTFSVREQERRLKMALREEERVSREAERVVHWVKQESARMDDSLIIKTVMSHDHKQTIK
jgi:hypothetical protein